MTAPNLALALLSAGVLLAFLRLARGPSLADRIVAVDHMSILAIGVIAVWGIVSGERAALDLAIVIALVSFLSTVALARSLEMRSARGSGDDSGDPGAPAPHPNEGTNSRRTMQ